LRQQLRSRRHQRRGDAAREVRFSARLIREGSEDAGPSSPRAQKPASVNAMLAVLRRFYVWAAGTTQVEIWVSSSNSSGTENRSKSVSG